jgi:hypothetical protein
MADLPLERQKYQPEGGLAKEGLRPSPIWPGHLERVCRNYIDISLFSKQIIKSSCLSISVEIINQFMHALIDKSCAVVINLNE